MSSKHPFLEFILKEWRNPIMLFVLEEGGFDKNYSDFFDDDLFVGCESTVRIEIIAKAHYSYLKSHLKNIQINYHQDIDFFTDDFDILCDKTEQDFKQIYELIQKALSVYHAGEFLREFTNRAIVSSY